MRRRRRRRGDYRVVSIQTDLNRLRLAHVQPDHRRAAISTHSTDRDRRFPRRVPPNFNPLNRSQSVETEDGTASTLAHVEFQSNLDRLRPSVAQSNAYRGHHFNPLNRSRRDSAEALIARLQFQSTRTQRVRHATDVYARSSCQCSNRISIHSADHLQQSPFIGGAVALYGGQARATRNFNPLNQLRQPADRQSSHFFNPLDQSQSVETPHRGAVSRTDSISIHSIDRNRL